MSDLANELLWGAGAIATDLFGRDTKKTRRKVYHLHQKRRLPTWKDGPDIITTKTLLRQHFSRPSAITAPGCWR